MIRTQMMMTDLSESLTGPSLDSVYKLNQVYDYHPYPLDLISCSSADILIGFVNITFLCLRTALKKHIKYLF